MPARCLHIPDDGMTEMNRCTTTFAASAFGIAPSKGITKAQAACAADVLINYGLGFVPGYNAAKLVGTLAGANFNFVQNLTAGKSIVTFDNGATITDPLKGILWGTNGLASAYSAISTAAASGLDASDLIGISWTGISWTR